MFNKPYIFAVIMGIGSLLYSITHSAWAIALSSAALIVVGIINEEKNFKNILLAVLGYVVVLLIIFLIF